MTDISKITEKGKFLFLAFDHGVEHGPFEYEGINLDPIRVVKIAEEGRVNGVILHVGAARYVVENYNPKIPIIIKVTGKTSLVPEERQIQEIVTYPEELVDLKISAIAATVYVGSDYEHLMLKNFAKLKKKCKELDLPLIGFFYPRSRKLISKYDIKGVAYAARVGCEIGADIIKTYWTGSKESFAKVVKNCFKPVGVAGGPLVRKENFLRIVEEAMEAGASGFAVGRNVWERGDKEAIELLRKMKKIIMGEE